MHASTRVRSAAALLTTVLVAGVAPLLAAPAQAADTVTALTVETFGKGLEPMGSTRVYDPAAATWTSPTGVVGELRLADAANPDSPAVTLRTASNVPFAVGTTSVVGFSSTLTANLGGLGNINIGCGGFGNGQLTVSDVAYDGTTLTRLSAYATGTCSSTRDIVVQFRYNAPDGYTALKGSIGFDQVPATKNQAQTVTATFANVGTRGVAVTDDDALVTTTNGTVGAVTDACRGTTVAPGSSCTVAFPVTPTQLGSPGLFVRTQLASPDLALGHTRAGRTAFVYDPATPHSAPVGVRAAQADDGVLLTWGRPASSGPITDYRVFRTVGAGEEELVATVTGGVARHEDHTAHDAGTVITYRVRATDRGVEGALSAPVAVTARALTEPVLGDRTALVLDTFASDEPGAVRTGHVFAKDANVVTTWNQPGAFDAVAKENPDGYGIGAIGVTAGSGGLVAGTHDVEPDASGAAWSLVHEGCALDGSIDVTSVNQTMNGVLREATVAAQGVCPGSGKLIRIQFRHKSVAAYSSVAVSATPAALVHVPVGGTPGLSTVTVRNEGTGPVVAGPVSLAPGTDPTWSVGTSSCTGAALAAAASCTAAVRYTPTAAIDEASAHVRTVVGPHVADVTVTASSLIAPVAPTGLTARGTKGAVLLTWSATAAPGTTISTWVYRGTSPTSLSRVKQLTDTDRWIDSGLAQGVTYYYAVTSANAAGESPRTATVSAKSASDGFVVVRNDELLSVPVVGGAPQFSDGFDLLPDDIVYDAAVSPDGQWIAYSAGDDTLDLFVMKIDGTQRRSVETLGGAAIEPAWSMDGQRLAFTHYSSPSAPQGTVYVTGAFAGGPELRFVSAPAVSPSWYPDGKHLLITLDVENPSLQKVAIAGGGVVATVAASHYDGVVSADGTKIAANRIEPPVGGLPVARLVVLPVKGGTALATSPLPTAAGVTGEPAWNLEGTSVWFTSIALGGAVDFGSSRLARLDLSTKQTTYLSSEHGSDFYAPSPAWNDHLKPRVSLSALSAFSYGPNEHIFWSGSDLGSGLRSYEVRTRTVDASGRTATRTTVVAGTAQSTVVKVPAAAQTCVSLRARDNQGNLSSWTAETCTLTALDQGGLTKSTGWTTSSSAAYFGGKALTTTKKGKTLRRSSVSTKRIGVVVRTCSTCGSFTVHVGSTKIGAVSTKGTSRYQKVIWLPASSTARKGTLKITTTSSKRVYVDALYLRH